MPVLSVLYTMDFLGFGMRILWTSTFIIGTAASGLVIYLSIFRTPKKYKNNTFFMRAHSSSEFIAGIFGFISMPRVIPAPDDIALSSYGICGLFGPQFCYYSTCIYLQSLAVAAAIVPINIIVRLYILTRQMPKASSLVLITVILVVPNIGLLILVISIYAPPSTKEYLISIGKIDRHTFETYPVYGFQSIDGVEFKIFFFILIFCSVVSSNISLIVRMIILKKLNVHTDATLSNSTIALQRRIIKMLTMQALLPTIGFIPSIQFFILNQGYTNSFLIQSTVLWVDSLFPFLSAFVYLMMVLEYKRLIFRRGGKGPGVVSHSSPRNQPVAVIEK